MILWKNLLNEVNGSIRQKIREKKRYFDKNEVKCVNIAVT